MRDFAVSELQLARQRELPPLRRPAARRGGLERGRRARAVSLTLKTWCFPVVGCVGYRGYFDEAGADALAAELRAQGLEVNVYGVPAYSTLGWLPTATRSPTRCSTPSSTIPKASWRG